MKIILSTVVTLPLMLLLSESALAVREKKAENEKEAAAHPYPVTHAMEAHNTDIKLKVQNDGERITVDATFTVPVLPRQVWAVLTDYDNIPNFISSIQSSKVIDRSGNTVHVSQSGVEKYGFLTISLESTREVSLSPYDKIQERMISGSMRKMEETTHLVREGNRTRVIYHADIIPGIWILKFVGPAFVENEARKQFQEIINEIIRRKQLIVTKE